MKAADITPNMKVKDRWYPEAGIGIVKSVLKTRVKVFFNNAAIGVRPPVLTGHRDGVVTYDNSHVQFLESS